jgi:hypothetical protein
MGFVMDFDARNNILRVDPKRPSDGRDSVGVLRNSSKIMRRPTHRVAALLTS